MHRPHAIGAAAEEQAARHLTARGLRLLARNYRCKGGEIDLVMADGDTLVFVEVRARAPSRFGSAGESITAAKRARVVLAARHYLASQRLDRPCRFDAVLLDGATLEWLRGAFEAG
ncbi:MAG: YraN family protein [Pseudomonadota bacterium]